MADSDSGNDLPKKFEEWNPMKDDFTNTNFNQYSSGPGANLELELYRQDKEELVAVDKVGARNGPKPRLVLRNVPKGMTKNSVYNLCSRHGKVSNVRECLKSNTSFVELASVCDLEAVYRGLENNTYGILISLEKRRKNRLMEHMPSGGENPEHLPSENSINIEDRSYRTSTKLLPRPKFLSKPLVSPDIYDAKDSLMQMFDPNREYLMEDDAHDLERAGYPNTECIVENVEYKYRTGRAYIVVPEKVKNFLKKLAAQSKGQYDKEKNVYQTLSGPKELLKAVGKCAQCNCLCITMCDQCPTYFCGIECQNKAWPQHSEVCGKPNSAESTTNSCKENGLEGAVQDEKKNTLSIIDDSSTCPVATNAFSKKADTANYSKQTIPCNGSLVKLTTISKANVVFIRSNSEEVESNLMTLLNNLKEVVEKNHLQHLQEPPKCGQMVIVRFKEIYNRAIVLNIDDLQRIKLLYVDYGNVDWKKVSDMYEASDDFTTVPRFATPVILKNVPNFYMTEQLRKFMYTYLENINMELKYSEDDYVVDKGVYMVELIDSKTKQHFNEMIKVICEPKEPPNGCEVFFGNYIKQYYLPAGENINLVVMDNSLMSTCYVSCTTLEWAVEIEKFQKALQKYGDSLPGKAYTPRIGELCIAKYSLDGKWYRGRCLEIVGDGFPSIIFFDYGNIVMIDINNIRLYPAQFTFPVYTCDCEIEGLPEYCDNKIVEVLEQMIPHNTIIKCDNVKSCEEEKFNAITLNNVIKKLQDDGLLKQTQKE